MSLSKRIVVALVCSVVSAAAFAESGLSGKLLSTGSDTMGALTSLWAETLMATHPQVSVQVRAIGSGAAPTALIEGTADIGPMSRPMSQGESRAFSRRFGYPPRAIPVALDEMAVFVHRGNPLGEISLQQLDAVFSVTRHCGYPQPLERWADLGLRGAWENRRISMYGRSTASGTYSFFRSRVLCGGDFKAHANRLVGASAVVRAVSKDLAAIGYASAGNLNSGVKRLRVVADDGDGAAATALSRRLLLYVNLAPNDRPEGLLAEFLRTALGAGGQREVSRAGYLPLPDGQLTRLRAELGLDR